MQYIKINSLADATFRVCSRLMHMIKRLFFFAVIVSALNQGVRASEKDQPVLVSPVSGVQTNLKSFKGIVATGPITVIVTMGDTESIRFEGDADAISSLSGEVQGSLLVVRPDISIKSWAKKYEGKKIIAHVTAKTLTSLTVSGNGSLTVKGAVHAAELATSLSGSGTIEAEVDADKVTATLSGSGTIRLTGNASDLNARISGSGSVYAHVSDTIKALISGSGMVYYAGNPNIEQKVFGKGSVEKM